jgi:DNA-directed RNA polymerase subunit RPC12/RpoP
MLQNTSDKSGYVHQLFLTFLGKLSKYSYLNHARSMIEKPEIALDTNAEKLLDEMLAAFYELPETVRIYYLSLFPDLMFYKSVHSKKDWFTDQLDFELASSNTEETIITKETNETIISKGEKIINTIIEEINGDDEDIEDCYYICAVCETEYDIYPHSCHSCSGRVFIKVTESVWKRLS